VPNEGVIKLFIMKIAIVIAFRNFRDEEYFIPKEIFEKAGGEVTTFSTALGTAVGVHGGETQAEKVLEEFRVSDFEAVVFVGGAGARELIDNPDAHHIAQEAVRANKVLAAICIAPTILAKAGVLFGKKATVWSSPMDKTAVKILREEGVNYREDDVVVDGKIVTARGPGAAEEFALTILQLLT
jgi:protease I